ncbi:MAG: hypothetical protein JO149_08625 [Gammaproteobacteria bacterium]|nr:hypothetical protein [Gammaproteobacteria bacterium]
MFSKNKGDGINGKLSTVGNQDVSYVNNKIAFIGNQNVTYAAGGRLDTIGGQNVYYINDKIDHIGNQDVRYLNGIIHRIGDEDVRYESVQSNATSKSTNVTSTPYKLPVTGYSLAFYKPATEPPVFKKPTSPAVEIKLPGCRIL